jgi:hypothetical protein
MLTTKYSTANHKKDDDIEMVCMENVMKACKIVVGKHGEEYNTDLRVLTLSNPIFLPTAYSAALTCFGRERGW